MASCSIASVVELSAKLQKEESALDQMREVVHLRRGADASIVSVTEFRDSITTAYAESIIAGELDTKVCIYLSTTEICSLGQRTF
jgi:hypothetical protein